MKVWRVGELFVVGLILGILSAITCRSTAPAQYRCQIVGHAEARMVDGTPVYGLMVDFRDDQDVEQVIRLQVTQHEYAVYSTRAEACVQPTMGSYRVVDCR